MQTRVIAGKFKGRLIPSVEKATYRPTMNKVRQALFSMLASQDLIADTKVLDLYAGLGSFSIEMVSRGAMSVTAVDSDRQALVAMETFCKGLGICNLRTVLADATKLDLQDEYDLVFMDPPYDTDLAACTLSRLLEMWPTFHGLVIVEASSRQRLTHSGYTELDRRKYGVAEIIFLTPCSR